MKLLHQQQFCRQGRRDEVQHFSHLPRAHRSDRKATAFAEPPTPSPGNPIPGSVHSLTRKENSRRGPRNCPRLRLCYHLTSTSWFGNINLYKYLFFKRVSHLPAKNLHRPKQLAAQSNNNLPDSLSIEGLKKQPTLQRISPIS